MKSVIVDGVEYEEKKQHSGTRAVVVVDRGWIFAGDVTRENGRIYLTRAVKNSVVVPAGAEVFCVPVADDWGL